MAANTSPIFLRTPRSSWGAISITANTATDGTGTTTTVFTADATNGSKIEDVYIQALGTNVATVVRFFVNNGSSSATPANNTLIHEETFAAVTLSQTAASVATVWRANLVLAPGYKLLACQGTTTVGALQVTAVGGDY